MCKSLILATLRDSGPAEFYEISDALTAAKARCCGIHADLYALIRERHVSVSMGVYTAVAA